MSMNQYSKGQQEQPKDHNHSVYSSTPDLSLRGSSHRRYSSTDSLEGSYYSGHSGGQSGHSRQGSHDSQEVIYPTRRSNIKTLRKQSSTTDPLQFIKTKGAQDLAHTAEVQMRVAAESKKGVVLSTAKDEDDDWQSELNSWKSRRKSQSERSYHLKGQLEEMEKEKAGDTGLTSAPKTFSQMQSERELRRSAKSFYPVQDDVANYDDDDAFVPAVSRHLNNSANESQDRASDKSQYSRNNDRIKVRETSQTNRETVVQNRSDTNNNYSNMSKQQNDDIIPSSASRTHTSPSDGEQKWSHRQSGNDRHTKQTKSGEDTQFSGFISSSSSSALYSRNAAVDSRNEGMPSRESSNSSAVYSRHSAVDSRNEGVPSRESSNSSAVYSRHTAVDSRNEGVPSRESSNSSAVYSRHSAVDLRNEGMPSRESSNGSAVYSRYTAVDSRNEGMPSRETSSLNATNEPGGRNETVKTKEGSTANKLQSERDVMAVKSGRNIGSRTQSKIGSILQNFEDSPVKSKQLKEGYNERIDLNARRSTFENVSGDDYRQDSSFSHSEDAVTEDSGDDSLQEVKFNSRQSPRSSVMTTSTVTAISTSVSSLPTVTSSASTAQSITSSKNTHQDYVSKTIKISQKANSEKGFGFFLSGGADKQTSLYVSKVVLGSAADVCDLKTRDVIQSVNQTDVSAMTAAEVGEIISFAVGQGYIEINVWREKDEDDYDEFGSSSDEGEEIISSPGYSLHQTPGIKGQEKNEERMLDFTTTTSSSTAIRGQQSPEGGSRFSQNSSDNHRDQSDETDFGPPALLRRWQQQQQQQQQQQHQKEKENKLDDDLSKFYSKINLNTSFTRSEYEREKELSADREIRYGTSEDWSNKIAELTKGDSLQDEEREKEKARLLEERRAERRARIMNSASPGSSSVQAQTLVQDARVSPQTLTSQTLTSQTLTSQTLTSQTLTSQTWAPTSQSQSSPQVDRRSPQQTWTSVPQPWVPPSRSQQTPPETRPSLPETRSTLTETRQPIPETRPPPTEIQTSVVQSWTTPSQIRISPANQSHPSQSSTPVHASVANALNGTMPQQGHSTPPPGVNSSISTSHTTSSGQTVLPSGFQTVKFVIDPRSKILIDPRNQQGFSDNTQPADMQARFDYQVKPDSGVLNLIEEERERIRNEELRRLKEERQRAEEELLRKEKEERLRLQREEEEIQRERELLRVEREKLLKEKEEFNRIKEQQLLQQQQQLQQQQHQQKLQQQQQQLQQQQQQQQHQLYQQQKQQEVTYEPNYQTNAYNNQRKQPGKAVSSGSEQNTFQPILSQQDQRQAVGYNLQQRNEHQNHPGVVHPQMVHSGAHLDQTRNFRPVSKISAVSQERAHSQNSELYSQSQIHQGSLHQRTNSSGLPSRPLHVNNIPAATRNDHDSSRNNLDSSRTDLRLSREEMLAMNRTAKPMSTIPTDARDNNNQGQSPAGPITREAPTREEIHSLNSVPKAKLRRDTDWQSTESLNSPKTPKSISPLQPENNSNKASWQQGREEKPASKFSLFTSGDHWLIQEAERRRIAESEAKLQPRRASNQRPSSSGPIKPAGDASNRWRGQGGFVNDQNNVSERLKPSSSMPAVIRQTLLQKTAGVRSSNEPAQTFPPAPSPSPSLSYHNSYHNQPSSQAAEQPNQKRQQWQYNQHLESPHHPQQQVAPGGPAAPPQRQHEIKMSGSQLCSHCEQELGYGAAMVIESLGLFFHVQCFRCWVCHASLGTGDQGADVRVRVNKLHCPNCYSNDEVGLRFSKV